ncbi:MAG: D-cysteine desulfhydrase family protein [Candidatus Binatia bacterium]|nr:D-cysteine desulfhydrase family protein [Candidatus Binatia bacterium]
MAARFDVERFPRIALGHGPTPLEPLERLSKHLGGANLWVKRDDCTGLALGGNKVRKLEYLLAEAIADGADTVITVGGVQSNHARQTAAGAARLGLRCELVLPRVVDRHDPLYEANGNILLDHLLGAHVHLMNDEEAAAARVVQLMEDATARGGKAAFFPSGGSTATGALGYVRAAAELVSQCAERNLRPRLVVVATSTGGTLAGLLTGLAALDSPIDVTGVAVYDAAETTRDRVRALVAETATLFGTAPAEDGRIQIVGDQLGPAYGQPTEAMREALELCARFEGLLLDPVYSGKAMAGLIDLVRRREIEPKDSAVFWHTGGSPALFAYG